MRKYEVMTIHRPEFVEDDVRAKVTEIEQLLKARGAEITDTDFWGKRRFAYEIKHVREGFYSVVQFDLEEGSDALDDLDRALALSDAVVRHKVVRRDNR
ncbi:MAG: 30S ribosomal protein S6 [Acidimicrobiia bacterium]|nr:30S ribosomal protein S6 [Acidimicrobiia bacterium]